MLCLLPQNPWALVSDGDILELFQKRIQCKDANYVRMSKVKSHATEQSVANLVSDRYCKIGDDFADTATEGIQSHGVLVAALSESMPVV